MSDQFEGSDLLVYKRTESSCLEILLWKWRRLKGYFCKEVHFADALKKEEEEEEEEKEEQEEEEDEEKKKMVWTSQEICNTKDIPLITTLL